MSSHDTTIDALMKQFYESLNEKDRRRYAGLEALKMGPGGLSHIAKLLGCSRRTVKRGAQEVSDLPGKEVTTRIREAGGGRKPYTAHWEGIDEKFLSVLREHTAGNPMDAQVLWTDLTPSQIVAALNTDFGLQVSKGVVRQLLKKHNYRRRQAQKTQTMKAKIPHRDEQFKNLARLVAEYRAAGNPILSMDTKKKEYLGNFYRKGQLYTLEPLQTYDHDFTSSADGLLIPHGIYDERLNVGYIHLGTSHDTSEFVCNCLRHWWNAYGQHHYPQATSILIRCDGGGSNSARHHIFKQDLQALADEIGIEIRIAHYPPYCSKFNPIEHRLFAHVTHACRGVVFTTIELVKQLMEKTQTQTGLKAFVHIMDKVYETGRKVAADFKETMRIVFDEVLPQWNYRTVPLQPRGQVI